MVTWRSLSRNIQIWLTPPLLYYVSLEDTFDVIKRAHIATGHGGRDRMIKELQRKYVNTTTKSLELYKSLCEECQKKRKRPMTNGVVVRPILTELHAGRNFVTAARDVATGGIGGQCPPGRNPCPGAMPPLNYR